ncbi:MAG: RidA family protein [Elusimicrobia bacterium]|nr:RidA family protein [Elusimicrobiota bacterium]
MSPVRKAQITSVVAPAAIGPYSQAIRAGGFVYLSGQVPLDPLTGALVPGGVPEQTQRVLDNLSAVLQAAGLSLSRVVKTTVYMTDLGKFAEMNAVYAKAFRDPAPARATVQVSALPKGAQVEIEAVAWSGG